MPSSPTAGLFQTTVLTVREWLRRFQQQGLVRPHRASRAPHHQPGKTPADIEQQVVALRQQLFTFSAQPFLATFVTRLAGMPGEAASKRAYCARLIGDAGLSDPSLFPAARGNGLWARVGDDQEHAT